MSIIEKALKNKLIKESVYEEDDSEQTFIDTGCLSLNLLFSGRLNGGIPVGKISQIAAPSSLGKTFIGLKVARNAQRKGMEVIYLDTEFAYDANFADNIGIDQSKILVIQDNRIERVQSKLLTITDGLSKEEKKSLFVVLDSWGGLVTSKTEEDAMDGNDKRDMTISQKKNSFARLLTGIEVSMFIINHVYDSMNQYDPLAIPGGRGLYFATSSLVLASSKARDKDGSDIIGAVVTATARKGRFAREHSKMKYTIKYDGGIHPVAGIEDDLYEMGYLLKPTQGYWQRNFEKLGLEGEDKKWRLKAMMENWKEFFMPILTNKDVLHAFEKKYTFVHSEIINDDLGDVFSEEIND